MHCRRVSEAGRTSALDDHDLQVPRTVDAFDTLPLDVADTPAAVAGIAGIMLAGGYLIASTGPLALGVVPVGMSKAAWGDDDGDGVLPLVEDKLTELGAKTPVLFDEADGIDFEAVADTQPDVILAAYSGLTQEEYDKLSKIAPTVAYPDIPWATSYQDMIRHTSTPEAPWYVVPADHKWFARLVVADEIVDTLESLNLSYPKVDAEKREELAKARAALEGEGS